MKTVTLVCGLPNAGKTTFCKKYDNVIHLDSMGHSTYEERFNECIIIAVNNSGDIVIDGNFYSKRIRKNMISALNQQQCKKVCIWINTPLETCLKRADSGGRSREIVNHINKWDELIMLNGDENRTTV